MFSVILFLTFALIITALPQPLQRNDLTEEADEPYLHVVLLDADHNDAYQVHSALAEVNLHPEHEDIVHIYNHTALKGFSVYAYRQRYYQLNNISSVAIVERDAEAYTAGSSRTPAPWGLERVSLGTMKGTQFGLNSTYSYDDASLGEGVDIYVLDAGIFAENENFSGRASNVWPSSNISITTGHGTHCAGIAGSDDYGVASNANLVGVQVLPGGTGSASLIIAGMTFAMETHDAKQAAGTLKGSVLSMSLQMLYGNALDTITYATAVVLSKGMHMVAAAGNDGKDACLVSPAAMGGANSSAIIVGSVGYDYSISTFSNFGSCVDVYAPGENILSTFNNGTYATAYLDGTSMATPFVAGIVASQINANASLALDPVGMKAWLKSVALPGFVSGNDTGVTAPLLANNGVPVNAAIHKHRKQVADETQLKYAHS